MIEDELLKWRFRRGSRDALARIYEKYIHLLLSVAMGLLNDPHEAEDVVQDVFVSFAKGADGFAMKGSLKAYLAQSVVNRVRDRVRRQRNRQRRVDALAATAGEHRPDSLVARIWSSIETGYPVRIEGEYARDDGPRHFAYVQDQFQWDVELDRSLFEPNVPAGYIDISPDEW